MRGLVVTFSTTHFLHHRHRHHHHHHHRLLLHRHSHVWQTQSLALQSPSPSLSPCPNSAMPPHHRNGRPLVCRASLDPFSTLPVIIPAISDSTSTSSIADAGYSSASYYTSLGLFVLSVPGVWSLIKRSTKSKIVKKTFVVPGPSDSQGKSPSQVAGEITSFFTRKNFTITDRGETVTFEGTIVPSRAQAAFLIFCTCISLGSIALVLTITVPEIGDKWYWLSGLSPLAGVYYWTRASRKEQIKVKMIVADDEASTDVILQGDDEEIDLLRRELQLMEKGMVYVKGLLER